DSRGIVLPATAGPIAVGGSGRYLIIELSQQNRLAIFDTVSVQILEFIPLPLGGCRFTAGRDKLVIGRPGDGLLERVGLATVQHEVMATVPLWTRIDLLAMGASSDGPVLVGYTFFDLTTLRPRQAQPPLNWRPMIGSPAPRVEMARASADGAIFGI